jgi:hypothetical protein
MARQEGQTLEKNKDSKAQWLMPVIPATQEAETRTIMVLGQPDIKQGPVSTITNTKNGWWNSSSVRT